MARENVTFTAESGVGGVVRSRKKAPTRTENMNLNIRNGEQ